MTASQKRGTIYIDVSNSLGRRIPKRWPRRWKIDLVENNKPDWNELFVGTGW